MNSQSRSLLTWQQRWQQFLALQKSLETEESILLRILVQALVLLGIVAVDLAAETQMSIWAVPLSLTGATWSWYRRRERNVMVKFAIAIGMLLALGVFFQNLLANVNDTRLVLASLLIHLQILHSFDLPRRTDLGYSMLIGLILLGVAATLSQTLAFAPILVLFLGISLPVLILDYRSRLGLVLDIPRWRRRAASRQPASVAAASQRYSPLAVQRLGGLLALILALGLILFAFMPRFPGYQQFTFPVSGAAEVENATFNPENRGIFNPGVREGNQTGGADGLGGEGGEGTEGEDNLYYGFRSQIDQQSQLGKPLSPQVVLRVRSQAPGFWRVLSFDRYTGSGWEISRDDQLDTLKRPSWSYRFFVSPLYSKAESQQVIQTYTIVSSLPNVIPALYQPEELYFPTEEIALDPEGNLRSPSALIADITYTAISDVPSRDRTQLRQASTDYSDRFRRYYLQIPPEIKARVRARAEELLSRANNPITSPYEQALYLAQALKQNYQIKEFPPLNEGEDLVETFLFDNEGGYPDHFSTVLTVMLRSLDIPARLTTGFGSGQFNPFTGFYLVRNTDAYALTEVFIPEYGWYSFDPIPGHEVIPISFEESQTFSVLRQFWHWVAGWLPSPVTSFFGYVWRTLAGAIATALGWLWAFVSQSWLGAIVGAIFAVGLGFLTWFVWLNWQYWRAARRLAKLPPMERLYQQMLHSLAAQGYAKDPAQTPLEYARHAYRHHQASRAAIIEEIATAYVRWRYGAQEQNLAYLQQQLRLLQRSFKRPNKSRQPVTS
jgi:transglutaminase-like putative cysteine protease